MFVIGVRNNPYHNFKIVFVSKLKVLTKIVYIFYKPFFNEIEIQNTKYIKIKDVHRG